MQLPRSTRSRYVLQHLTTYCKWLILMCLRNGMVISLTILPSPLSALSPSLDILPATHVPFPPPSKTSWCLIYLVLIASSSGTVVVVMPPPNTINSSVDVGFLQCSKILPPCSPLASSTFFHKLQDQNKCNLYDFYHAIIQHTDAVGLNPKIV